MSFLEQLRGSIEARLDELGSEIAMLEAARDALRGERSSSPPSHASNGNAASAAKPRGRGRARGEKAGEVLLADRLEAMLRESDEGFSAITISKRANAAYGQVLGLLRELEQSGRVGRSGTRRTSLWRLITEEERIAERATELERASAAPGPTGGPTGVDLPHLGQW